MEIIAVLQKNVNNELQYIPFIYRKNITEIFRQS